MQRNFTASQLFSRLLTSCHLFSTTLISAHLVKALLNSLFISLPSSQLFSARAFPFARSLWPVQFAFILLPGNYNIGATIHNSLTSSSIVLLFNSTGSLLPIASSMLHPNRIPNRSSFQHLHPFLHSPSIMYFHSNLVDCGTNVQQRCSRSILSRAVTSRGALMAPVRCTPFACRSRRQQPCSSESLCQSSKLSVLHSSLRSVSGNRASAGMFGKNWSMRGSSRRGGHNKGFVFCNSVSADRSGMAASRFLKSYLFLSHLLRF